MHSAAPFPSAGDREGRLRHEDPGRGAIVISTTLNSSTIARAPRSILVPSSRHSSGGNNNSSSLLMRSPDPLTMPITIAPSAVCILILILCPSNS